MFRGFNLIDFPVIEDFYQKGLAEYDKSKTTVNKVLENYIISDGSIDGTKLQEIWLPQIDYDVFVSHSHKDKKSALTFAGMLCGLNISCFVDSCIWGNCDELLKIIDNKHCYSQETNTYDYHLRNTTTSHVHMMLSNAISQMIDSSECLFFLNSPNSIKINDVVSKTISPWIYTELFIANVIRKKKPKRHVKPETRKFSEEKNINEAINIEYDVNLSLLTKVEVEDFKKWLNAIDLESNEHILDTLYKTFPPPRKQTTLDRY